jgi:hypothetical protein
MIAKSRSLGTRVFYLLMVFCMIFALGAPSTAFAQDSAPFTATPLFPDSTISVDKSTSGNSPMPGMVSVIVKLQGASLATYTGDISGLAATSPSVTGEKKLNPNSKASNAYLKYLDQKHQNFKSAASATIPQGQVTQDLKVILNAVAMIVPADQVSSLYALPNVEAVYPDELLQLNTDNSPQFIGAPTVWSQLGGQESSGEGVIVGVLDTGIWPEHPSFSDPDPSGKPYAAPPTAPSNLSRACNFSSGAQPGPAFSCNNKLIGANVFMNTYRALQPVLLPDDYTSARDSDGHGTHTSSTAAGNADVAASIYGVSRGVVSGIAPRAYVIMYRVCGSAGCYSSDSAAAVQQAILDGVDVINFSISGGANPYSDVVEQAFLNAYNADVFVAASAGNSGPASDTTDHRGPWVTTVAASTQDRAFENTVTLTADGGASLTVTGASITAGLDPAPVVVPTTDVRCDNPFAAGSVAGQVVVCKRGNTGRAQKGYNVLQGGAVGMILYNNAANVTDLETDNHYLPATHIQYSDGTALLSFITAHTNVQATLTAGVSVAAQGDVMASFSSRGGAGQTLGVSKPDVTAPGVQILAGHSPQHLAPPAGVALGPQGELFQAIAGTSMSSPHIAGSAALLKALHPDWTPGQIKSALMTTAWTQVVKEDGATPATPFDDGSGRVDLNKAGDPGLTFDVSAANYVAHQADLWNVNYPSIYLPALVGTVVIQRTAHSLLPYDNPWDLQVVGATDFTVSVPNNIMVPANGNATINIVIDAKKVPLGEVRTATLYLIDRATQGARTLHIPITFVRKQAPVTLAKTCSPASIVKGKTTNCMITFQNTTFIDAQVNVVDSMPSQLKLVASSVVGAQVTPGAKALAFSGTLPAAQPPDVTIGLGSSPAGGYLPLSLFGVTPISGVTDDSVTNFNLPAFTYAGNTYTRLGVGSNGYLVLGGATGSADVQFLNQSFPNPTRPNNVLSPFWTDFNPPAGGAIRVATLTDGVDTWIVVDWAGIKEFSSAKLDTFEVWIGLNNDANPAEDISFAFGPIQGNGDGGLMTVGAENLFGNRGANYYYNGTGTLPAEGTQLVVTGTPGVPSAAQTITFTATGNQYGTWVNYAQMVSNLFQGVSVASFTGKVTK